MERRGNENLALPQVSSNTPIFAEEPWSLEIAAL